MVVHVADGSDRRLYIQPHCVAKQIHFTFYIVFNLAEEIETCIICVLRVHNKNYFCYFSTKTYVVGTQKNHLVDAALLSILNIC